MPSPPTTATKPISPPPIHRKSENENDITSNMLSTNRKQTEDPARKTGGYEKHGHDSRSKPKGGGKGGGKQLTHFLCLPLVTPDSRPQLQQSLERFRDTVGFADQDGNDESTEGERSLRGVVPEGAIRPLGALHLTIGVMSLSSSGRGGKKFGAKSSVYEGQRAEGQGGNTTAVRVQKEEGGGAEVRNDSHITSSPDETSSEIEESSQPNQGPTLERAIQVIQSIDLNSLLHEASQPAQQHGPNQSPLTISLRGVHTFSPNKTKTSILFANPHDPTSRLYPFARSILSRFIAEGLIQPRGGQGGARGSGEEELVLHATLVNTTYAKDKNKGKGPRGKGRGRGGKIEFDAKEIMSVFNEQGGGREGDVGGEFVWADGVVLDRVVICEMGAKKVEDEAMGMEYVRVAEKMIV